jgi:hypothetical protein
MKKIKRETKGGLLLSGPGANTDVNLMIIRSAQTRASAKASTSGRQRNHTAVTALTEIALKSEQPMVQMKY